MKYSNINYISNNLRLYKMGILGGFIGAFIGATIRTTIVCKCDGKAVIDRNN